MFVAIHAHASITPQDLAPLSNTPLNPPHCCTPHTPHTRRRSSSPAGEAARRKQRADAAKAAKLAAWREKQEAALKVLDEQVGVVGVWLGWGVAGRGGAGRGGVGWGGVGWGGVGWGAWQERKVLDGPRWLSVEGGKGHLVDNTGVHCGYQGCCFCYCS
jgi:hypothetical protein